MKKVLGLDLGTSSIGWALLEFDEKKPQGLIDAGVRIFTMGVNEKGDSKNKKRRDARAARRLRFRKNKLKRMLRIMLQELKWIPTEEAEYRQWENLNPYLLRKKALDYPLTLAELGRIFYHLSMRRGFISNRKAQRKKDDDSGVVKKAISELEAQIKNTGSRTLGEYLADLYIQHEEKIRLRKRYTHRKMYIDEFNLIWETQKQYHPQVLTPELLDKIRDYILFYQRPLKIQKYLVGKCDLEPSRKRCPKSRIIFQEYRIWDKINNLSYYDDYGEKHCLTDDQRKILFNKLNTKEKMKFDAVRKLLKLPFQTHFNLESEINDILIGNKTNWKLSNKKYFGKHWYSLPREIQNRIIDVVQNCQKEDIVKKLALEEWNCSEEQAEELCTLQLPDDGYARYSEKVLKKLLPHLRSGKILHEVVEAEGYKGIKGYKNLDYLPQPPNLRNPVVNRGLYELRKVINAIIRKYGKPDEIRIELARDLKMNKKSKERLIKQQAQFNKLNAEARVALTNGSFGIQRPSRDDLLKYRLWKECNERCPYTGETIPATKLFTQEIQVEHILPYSKTLDDSFQNKTLAVAEINAIKGNRSPYEAFSGNPQFYQAMLSRIKATGNKGKYKKFMQKEVGLEGFIHNQLNDTQYFSLEAKEYLKDLGIAVTVTKGQATATLRRCWNLNSLINHGSDREKNRADHRHHAIDAFVVALTHPGTLQHLSRIHGLNGKFDRVQMPEPYPGYRSQLDLKLTDMIISFQVNRKVSGALHEETFYGKTGLYDEKKQPLYVVTKPVHVLTPKEVTQIRDPYIRRRLKERIQTEQDAGKSLADIMKVFESEPFTIPSRKNGTQVVRKVRLLKPFNNMKAFKDKNKKPFRYAEFGSNHHIVIFEYTDAKGQLKKIGIVTRLDDAVNRLRNTKHVIQKKFGESYRFLYSFSINEMIENLEDGEIYRVQMINYTGKITFRHQFAATLKYNDQRLIRVPNTLKAKKIKVSPIGEVWETND